MLITSLSIPPLVFLLVLNVHYAHFVVYPR